MTGFPLAQAGDGERVEILAVDGGVGANRKLSNLGLTPGTRFRLKRLAPLGNPVEIEVRGFSLSLRKVEADAVQVQRED